MAIIKSFSPFQNLSNFSVFLNDLNPNSDFFRISEFKDTLTGGKNGFLIEGSPLLKESTELKIEILDVDGNPIYYEPGKGYPDYYEGLSSLVSIHVYPDTPIGLGKITILGELKEYIDSNGTILPVPDQWKGVYNVKWEREIKINKNLANEDRVRFYRRPLVKIDELVKPVLNISTISKSQTGTVRGVSIQPIQGTNLDLWSAGMLYKLQITDGTTWSSFVDENQITITPSGGTPFTSNIVEVLNSKEVLIDIPYSVNSLVQNFTSGTYTVNYTELEQNTPISAITGSFAKINLSNLKTFVGDVHRVKIFSKSKSDITDFKLIQDTKLESTELLRDIDVPDSIEVPFGNFTQDIYQTYWEATNVNHPVSINLDKLFSSIRIQYNSVSGGFQVIRTKKEISISNGVEYTLNFKTLISGSNLEGNKLRAYLSSSNGNYIQDIVNITSDSTFGTRQNITSNIIANPITDKNDVKLVFEISGSDWYISNISLKTAQDTSFSPDEFLLIQEIPRKLESETFDFKFEFYDINNNYIPVDVFATKVFNGGNNFITSEKIVRLTTDRNLFKFTSGSIGNPINQLINFTTTRQNLTGNITYVSSAFDINGNIIPTTSYTGPTAIYPGLLTNITNNGATLTLANFTGSSPSVQVGSIRYTAKSENVEDTLTIFRLEDGSDSPQLIVSSNTNQFIYEPTTLSPKPDGQFIIFRVNRKNLNLSQPLTVTSQSISDVRTAPTISLDNTSGDIVEYRLTSRNFSSSYAGGRFPEVNYAFSGSDIFGNIYSDSAKVTPVINFDGISLSLTNENTSFPANSRGVVDVGGLVASSGSVEMFIAGNRITHDDELGGRTRNTFNITSSIGTGVFPTNTSPTTQNYSISGFTSDSIDSGSLLLNIDYLAGDNFTTQSFQRIVNYSKVRRSAPELRLTVGNNVQNVTARSTGVQLDSFLPLSLSVTDTYKGSSVNRTLSSPPTVNVSPSGYTLGTITPTSISLPNLPTTLDSVELSITGSVIDSEGATRNVFGNATLTKTRRSKPTVNVNATPITQTVSGTSTGSQIGQLSNVSVSALEGTTSVFTSMTATYSGFSINPTINSNTLNCTTATISTAVSEAVANITVNFTDSEGTTGSSTLVVRFTKVNVGANGNDGQDGADGQNGTNGANGVVINVLPPNQTVKLATDGTYGTPTTFNINVVENGTLYTHTTTSPLDLNNTFRIVSISNASLVANSGTTNPSFRPTTPTSSTGTDVTINIQYRTSSGVISTTIPVKHIVSVTFDGTTGPGVVHTGIWQVGRIYQFDTGLLTGTGRRDTVLWSPSGNAPYTTFYASTTQHTATIDNAPHIAGSPWISLGNEDFFVAAKIGIFKESYIQNTLNIGTNTFESVSSANITIYGGNQFPYISIGQANDLINQGYNKNGIWIGRDSDSISKLSLVNGNTSFLKWNGTSLEIKGSIAFTNNPPISTFNNDSGFTDDTTANEALSVANSRPKVFRQISQPSTSEPEFSLWYDTDDDNTLYILETINGTKAWRITKDGDIQKTLDYATSTSASLDDELIKILNAASNAKTGTFINKNLIFSPLIAGTNGYISGSFKVGQNGITLDGPSKKIFTGTGTFNNSNTPFYVDSSSNFSLGNKVSWNGTTLRISGNIDSSTISGTQLDVLDNGIINLSPYIINDDSSITIGGNLNFTLPFTTGNSYGFIRTYLRNQLTTSEMLFSSTKYTFGEFGISVPTSISGTTFATLTSTKLDVVGDVWGNTSDKRLKTNVVKIPNPLEKLKSIDGVYFNWNETAKILNNKDTNRREVGFLAQDVQSVLPEIVGIAPFDNDGNGNSKSGETYLTIQYEKIVPLLVESIKELKSEIDDLKLEIMKLRGEK